MKRCTLSLLVLAALAAGEGREGSLELSDGSVVSGRIRFVQDIVLTELRAAEGRTHRIDPSEVSSLEMIPVRESMERPYTFKNPGDPTKTFGEGLYPLRNLRCRLALRDGRALEGAFVSRVVYVAGEDGVEQRFKVVAQQKGAVGQTLADLVYVRSIRWDEPPGATLQAAVRGRVRGPHALEEVVAFHRESGRVFRGVVTAPEEGTFELGGLPAGTVDLVVQTTNEFLHPYGAGGELGSAERAEVQAATLQASDFFEERNVLALAGTRKAARALVLKRRLHATSYERELAGARMWRLEIWLWHGLEREWRLDRRLFLLRGTEGEEQVVRTARHCDGLGGLVVEAGHTTSLEAGR